MHQLTTMLIIPLPLSSITPQDTMGMKGAIADIFMIVDRFMGIELFDNILHLLCNSMMRRTKGINIVLELIGDISIHNLLLAR